MTAEQGLADLLPHAGNMCLLDEVLSWNQAGVICRSASQQPE